MTALLVAAGAAVGAVLRALSYRVLQGPRATLAVNVSGSLLLGLLAGAGPTVAALLGVGFCGALTTFSTFSLEVLEEGGWPYLALSTAACLAACAVGLALA